jgi:hypothetical protein
MDADGRTEVTNDDGPPPPEGARPVPGFPWYAVGADGVVWTRAAAVGGTRPTRPGPWREKVPFRPNRKLPHHRYVNLSHDDGVRRRVRLFPLAVLVLEAWAGPAPTPSSVPSFLDGDRSNCRPDNLAWADAPADRRRRSA